VRRMESLQEQLLPIGRFARLTGLTVKALRHYDELGLLRPAAVDADTGYRFYAPAQVVGADTIRHLRRLELPLDDVRTLLETDDPEVVRRVLVAHQRRTAWRAAELKIVLQGLQPLIDGKEPVMGTHAEAIDPEARRRLAADLFNKTWTLMEKPDRTPAEDDEMLHMAHASRHHWGELETGARLARGEWQCSRVYTVLGRPEPALHHARRCLELCEAEPADLEDWDLPFAYEALARAYAVAGDEAAAAEHVARARDAGEAIAEEDDRMLLEADLATIGT
jgi:DNA-binding transcriptional MerR regulator